jgi:hypothetical protein
MQSHSSASTVIFNRRLKFLQISVCGKNCVDLQRNLSQKHNILALKIDQTPRTTPDPELEFI